MKTKTDFFLRKWYMDCIADNGDTFIGYSASLVYKGVRLHYANFIAAAFGGIVTTGSSISESSAPAVTGNSLEWSAPSLQISGKWQSLASPLRLQLFNEPDGSVDWHCIFPLANARVSCGGFAFEGVGYCEYIEMTLPPWRLSIDELRWGRFCSDNDYLVWIDVRGTTPLTVVNSKGVDFQGCMISDDDILLTNCIPLLSMNEKNVLRQGPLISTALASIPGISSLAPIKFLQTYECKWRQKGKFHKPGAPIRTGWIINEMVRF